MDISLEVKNHFHPLGEQVEEINTVEELQEIVLEIISKTIEKDQELGEYRSHIDLIYTNKGYFWKN